ncbi:MAG: PQQ-binding-like beta-propeller repeat protein [bacterium]|jgi:outer membrane protein assembly factor BamB
MMKRHFCTFTLVSIFLFTVPALSISADWSRFLGPDGNGISSETGLADEWSEDGPKELWSFPLGEGFGSPAIVDGKVYVLDRVNNQQDVMRCIDLESGKELWSFGYDAPGRLSYNGSRSIPSVDEEHVYSVGPFGDVYCISLETHKPVWNRNLPKEFGGNPPNWGFAHSPVLHNEYVLVAPMSNSAGVVALNRKTGDVVWKSPAVGGEAYTTPVVTTIDGVEQILFLTQTQLSSINPKTGELFWTWDGYQCKIPIPSPAPLGEGKFFLTGGYGAGTVIVQVKKDGEDWTITELQRIRDDGAQIHQVTKYDGHLYANFNRNENISRNPMGLVCMDTQGNIQWSTKDDPSMDRGGFIIVDGKILALGGESGILYMLEATPEEVKVLNSAPMFDNLKRRDNTIWAPLALSNGRLIIRNLEVMKCLDLRSGK